MHKLQKKNKSGYCGNCGKYGHKYKECYDPIISYGIILVKLDKGDEISKKQIDDICDINNNVDITNKVSGIRCNNNFELNMFSLNKDKVKFLLIQRKYTLGYGEFIRGRYVIDNIDGIIFLFQQMTPIEIEKINKHDFDTLWEEFWLDPEKKTKFADIYSNAKMNFELLKKSDCSHYLNLDFYTTNITPTWNNPEWGFPKGRRNIAENDLDCAIREFEEETGFNKNEYTILNNIEPIVEDLIGTNGKKYRHIYYLALTYNDIEPHMENINIDNHEEIGDIGLYTYEESLHLFRTHHVERKKILTIVYIYMLNKFVNHCEDIIY
jgi:8-oxo-dGTP pyrophosphatase MutT (NUDIX family)